jgi:cytochrome c oxidase cbb3-type subunit 3
MGARLFYETCAACHSNDGRGNREIGAPNLADAIWLNSKDGSIGEIMSQLKRPRHGMMPAWVDRLDENSLRQLTIYVHELGGGE